MKKHLALALAFIIMSVTACGGAAKGTEQAAEPVAETIQAETSAPAEAEVPAENQATAEASPSETAAAEAAQPEVNVTIPYWTEGSAVADSIVAYVRTVMWRRQTVLQFSILTGLCMERDILHILTRACSSTERSTTRLSQHLRTSGSMQRQWKRPSTITCRNRIPTSRQHSAQPSVSRE